MKIEDNVGIKPRKRNLEETEMDITPMIDITFLLLIFFLVACNSRTRSSDSLNSARAEGRAVSAG